MTNANQIAMGESHMCEIRNGGEVWCVGSNLYGQLGDGSTRSSSTMVRAGDITNAVSVWAGVNNSFAITATGDLYAWGENDYGQLGVGDPTDQQSPVLVPGVSGVKKVSARPGNYHTIILLDDGTVRVAGNTSFTGEHNGSSSDIFGTPTSISGLAQFSGVKDIANGWLSTYLINGDGTVWGVGYRAYNALADGSTYGNTVTWQRIGNRTDVEQLWGRFMGGVYRTTSGECYGWGSDNYGQLGLGSAITNCYQGRGHTLIPSFTDARQLAFGSYHTLMLKNDGTLWASGSGMSGQLGDGAAGSSPHLVRVGDMDGDIMAISAANAGSAAFTTTGRYAWGSNQYGQLGLEDDNDHTIPYPAAR